jgi:hypothetical protein
VTGEISAVPDRLAMYRPSSSAFKMAPTRPVDSRHVNSDRPFFMPHSLGVANGVPQSREAPFNLQVVECEDARRIKNHHPTHGSNVVLVAGWQLPAGWQLRLPI